MSLSSHCSYIISNHIPTSVELKLLLCITLGLCLNTYECRIQNGESHGACALGFGVCCVCKYTIYNIYKQLLHYIMHIFYAHCNHNRFVLWLHRIVTHIFILVGEVCRVKTSSCIFSCQVILINR